MASRRITTPIFRVSFPNLIDPKEDDNGNWSYGLSMIFEPDTDFTEMKNLFNEVVQEKWKGSPPKVGVISPFRRGEWKSQAYPQGFDLDKRPEYTGKVIVSARAYTDKLSSGVFDLSKRPGIVGPDPKAPFDPVNNPADTVYSGMYARAEISMYVPRYGDPRVAVGLHNVQKCYDGERLSGGNARPEDVFDTFMVPDAEGNNADLLDLSGI